MLGMFPVADHPAVMLFDSGASHTFINRTFVIKHEIPIGATKEKFLYIVAWGTSVYKGNGVPGTHKPRWAHFSHHHDYFKRSGYRCDPRDELDASA